MVTVVSLYQNLSNFSINDFLWFPSRTMSSNTQSRGGGGAARRSGFESRVSSSTVDRFNTRQTKEYEQEEGDRTPGISGNISFMLILLTLLPALALLIYGAVTLLVISKDAPKNAQYYGGLGVAVFCLVIVAVIAIVIGTRVLVFDQDKSSKPYPVFDALVMYFFLAIGVFALTGMNQNNFDCDQRIVNNE